MRLLVLAPLATPPTGDAGRGRVVCNCLNVSEADLAAAIAEGAGVLDFAALQARLRCGTSCGSCVPEIRRMLAEGR